MTKTVTTWKRLWRDRRAAAMPIVVASLVPVIGTLGAAVDTGRSYMAKSQLQAGVDAAALAGARAFARTDGSATSRTGQAESYFYGNFPKGYLGVEKLELTTKFETSSKGVNVTTVTATADLPLMFMGLFGYKVQKLGAVARAELQPRPLEVMVVLDNTGSMKDNLPADKNGVVKTRMTATKDAAKSFIDILYQGAETRSELAIGFLSYDITVNVGNLLTAWKPSSVKQMFGFNDPYMLSFGGTWPNNKLAWKGCVFADDTVKDLNTNYSYQEPGAWDIDRTLPGEGSHPAVSPYFVPPFWVPLAAGNRSDLATLAANRDSDFYKVSGVEPGYNLYKLDASYWTYMLNYDAYNNRFANNPYRKAFYDYYMGLNNGASTASDDVITRTDGSYYDPATDKWDFKTRTGTDFKVNYDRVPSFALWKEATAYHINPLGGSTNSGSQNKTENPSPNWQCPDAAYPVAYGRTRTFYRDEVIGKHNGAIYPANGTLHHSGLLWGYRLLVRDDVFTRNNPTNEEPKRALVFMTDGETALGTTQNGYTNRTFTFYGNYADAPISTRASDLTTQSERRFSKTCASLQAEKNPPAVYIISLVTKAADTIAMFERCAPGHVYQTSDTASLKEAFDDIATELVDLHLTK